MGGGSGFGRTGTCSSRLIRQCVLIRSVATLGDVVLG
jgi:hypothetical protein